MLIGQNIGLEYLIPLALERLADEPLAEGDYYPGDLWARVLRADSCFWADHPGERQTLSLVVTAAISLLPTLDPVDRDCAQKDLAEANDIFQRAEYFAKYGRA